VAVEALTRAVRAAQEARAAAEMEGHQEPGHREEQIWAVVAAGL